MAVTRTCKVQGARCKAQPTIVKVIVLKPGRLCVLPTTLVLTTIVKVSAIKGILDLLYYISIS